MPPRGTKHTAEARAKIAAAHRGMKLGIKLTDEHKAKIAASMRGKQNSLGTKHTDETRAKMSEAQLGPKHPRWKGGVKAYSRMYPLDGVICERCNKKPAQHRHHIDRNHSNNERSNIELLCASCHRKEHV